MAQDIQPQVLHVPAGPGVDEYVRSDLVVPGQANLAQQNVRATEAGGLVKRQGFALRPTSRLDGTTRTAGRKLFSHFKQTCVVTGTALDVYAPGLNVDATIGNVPELNVERITVAGATLDLSGITSQCLDIAAANGMYFVVCGEIRTASSGKQLNMYVVDQVSRATMRVFANFAPNISTLPTVVRLAVVGNIVICTYGQSGSTTIYAVTFDATSASSLNAGASAATSMATNWNNKDLAACSMATSWVLAYTDNNGAITVIRANTSLAALASAAPAGPASINGVAVDGSESDFLWLAWATSVGGVVKVMGLNPTAPGTITSSATNILTSPLASGINPSRVGITRTSATGGYVCARGAITRPGGGWWEKGMVRQFHNSAGAVVADGAAQNATNGWTPQAQPFVIGSNVYMAASYAAEDGASPGTLTVYDVTGTDRQTLRPVASPARGLFMQDGIIDNVTYSTPHAVSVVSANKVAFLMPIQFNAVNAALEIVELDNTSDSRWAGAEHNSCSIISAGQLYAYDGAQVFEVSYVGPPSIRAVGAGAGVPNGTYNYTAIVEWTDAEGNVHWSEPAAAQTVAVVNQQVTLTLLQYNTTWKDGTTTTGSAPNRAHLTKLKIFRTKAGGGAYYLLTTVYNDFSADTYAFTDNFSDAAIGVNAKLYTQPGLVGTPQVRRCPPGVAAMAEYRGTICIIADDRKTVWMSAQRVVGEGLWFNDVWQYPIEGDDLQAIVEQDDALYVFSRRNIFAMSGDPPADNGAGGLGTPRRTSSDVGCIEPRSVVRTSLGIFFQSNRGIELLSRAGTVDWIGRGVRKTVGSNFIVTSAVVDRKRNVVIFTTTSSETNGVVGVNGPRLIFDLGLEKWVSTDMVTGVGNVANTAAQSGAIVWDVAANDYVYAWLEPGGTVHVESTTSWLDAGQYWVTAQFETPRLRTPTRDGVELQREHEFWQAILLYKRQSAAGLLCEVAYDFNDYVGGNNKTFVEATVLAQPLQLEFRVTGRRQAVKFRISDTAPAVLGTGQGLEFTALSLDLAPHQGPTQGTPKLPPGARA